MIYLEVAAAYLAGFSSAVVGLTIVARRKLRKLLDPRKVADAASS